MAFPSASGRGEPCFDRAVECEEGRGLFQEVDGNRIKSGALWRGYFFGARGKKKKKKRLKVRDSFFFKLIKAAGVLFLSVRKSMSQRKIQEEEEEESFYCVC